jgi:bifunctional non-homologous end joining protein LigD
MLATLVDQPFHKPGWVYEEKYDGYRILAYKEGASVTLLSRNANDRTEAFSSIAKAVAALPARSLLLDGEAVAFDRKRVSRFQLLQVGKSELVYAVFDCLFVNGRDLRRQPLPVRRTALEETVKSNPALLISRRLSSNGLDAYKLAQRKGFEGVLAKDESSPYIEGRSSKWVKFKVHQEEEFVIAGYTAPAGSREHFGALLLGIYDRGKLRYVGKVGTGFSRQSLGRLFRQFKTLEQSNPSLVDPPREKDVTHLAPRLVAQIAFQEWTADQKLRQPVFLGLRDDKRPEECVLRH